MTTLLEAALHYASLGWPVVPLHTPDEAGTCDCPKRAACVSPGKHPRTMHGLEDATADEGRIKRWWTMWPHANIGVDLARSGLVDIAPDSLDWYAEFEARGLPPTLTFASGGGAGHEHHLYVRSADCPTYRLTETGQYDVLSAGYAVMPPSRHQSQRLYTWIEPEEVAEVTASKEAQPVWAMAMIVAKQRPLAGSSAVVYEAGAPPVMLRGEALERWYGRAYDTNPQGVLDRSYSLWRLATILLAADCAPHFVEELLAERDASLGWTKFVGRRDAGERYRVIVERAVASKGPRRIHLNQIPEERAVEVQLQKKRQLEQARTFIITNLATVQPERVEWLWQHRIPLGKLTLLDGDPGLGKSLLTLDIGARLSRGHAMPDGSHAFEGIAGMVLLSAEDGIADTIRPRMDQAGGDPSRIVALEGVVAREGALPAMPSLEDLDAIEAAVRSVDARLVIVDPIMAYLPTGVSAFNDQEVRHLLGPLVQLISRLGVALICVRHLNKDTSKPTLYRGGGTIGFAGAARSVMLVGLDPADESRKRRILARQKGNLAPPWKSLAYEMIAELGAEQPHIRWGKESDLHADDLLAPRTSDSAEVVGQLSEAEHFLHETLSGGQQAAERVMAEAVKLGISRRTLERAKARIGIRSLRSIEGDQARWYWALGKTANLGGLGNVGGLGDVGGLENGDDDSGLP